MSEAVHSDYQGAKIGMWLFLFTELMLFGGLFLLYSAYRMLHPEEFHHASQELNAVIGVANTLVLLTSSLFIAMALTAVQQGRHEAGGRWAALCAGLGGLFLVNKGFEWAAKFHHGIYPGSSLVKAMPPGEGLFFGLYFTMTGLHALHVLIGVILLAVVALLVKRGRVRQGDCVLLENSGLYWHLVDVIWIFLLPLFYLAA
ncbi:MAG: cytochrome c oxidase subunit 3 family protein [Elusimicrobia bacterium]|nr:cytochrome c oxidase subunit 3 family protein [Elusimicrobiota bacterium]